MKNFFSKYVVVAGVSLLFSCSSDPNQPETANPKPDPDSYRDRNPSTPNFNADSAYQFTQKQVDFGPRVPGSKAHESCGNWMIEKLKSYGWKVTEQNATVTVHDGKKFKLKNIVASWKPELGNRILLVAHWDTRPWADSDDKNTDKPADGADDGASGAGVLLEIARQIQGSPIEQGIDIFLNDLEDYGKNGGGTTEDTWCVGTQYWAKNPHVPNYTAQYGILLDMVGAKGSVFMQEEYSNYFAPTVLKKVWDKGIALGYSDYFLFEQGGRVTDDHYYVNTLANIPTIDIIGVQRATAHFGEHHHTHADNMSVIDKNILKAVGQTVLGVIYSGK